MQREEALGYARRWCDAWNDRDIDAVLAHFEDDVTFTSPTALATVGTFFPREPVAGRVTRHNVSTASRTPKPRRNVYSGTAWEPKVAYCRAKRVGDTIVVSGTVAVDEHGEVVGSKDAYTQTRYALAKMERALQELGATMRDVVRTRTYITDINLFEDFARAHREVFEGIDPAATCVEVSRLVHPDLVVEIEIDATVDDDEAGA